MRGSLGSLGGGSDRRLLGIGIRFFFYFTMVGGGRGVRPMGRVGFKIFFVTLQWGGGVRPMGRVGFRNKGSMGKGLTLYLNNF
jgi:hypothetical protein